MSAPTSRLATYMCARLGHRNWKAFVKHANAHYKDRYVRAFVEQPHVCVGPLDGAGCPHAFRVDLDGPEAGRMLGHLHLDPLEPEPASFLLATMRALWFPSVQRPTGLRPVPD